MSSMMYKIDRFFGINQSVDENFLSSGYTADACNICTDDGNLSVAKGFTPFVLRPVPDEEEIYRCVLFRHSDGDAYIAVAGNSIYVSFGTVWLNGYTYSSPLKNHDFDFLEAKIGSKDYLIIGNGETELVKFDGHEFTPFGSEELCSDRPVRYLAMYKNRLFAAGESEYPNRLYWSKLPGDDRSIEDWGADEASPNVEGGHTQIGMFDNDPIVAITPLASQLLIFKKNSLYRLYGDKPSNFTVEEIESVIEPTAHTSIVHYGDVAYFMTKAGLYVFDGVSAHLMQDALCIKNILADADMSDCRGARTRDKLYFTFNHAGEPAMIEYDIKRHTYMLRKGFYAVDVFARDNDVFIMCNREVCKFNVGNTYAGQPIEAYWRTPFTDLNDKSAIKGLRELYLRGQIDEGKSMAIETLTGGISRRYNVRLYDDVTEILLSDEGRCFSVTFSNIEGSSFNIRGGIELRLNVRRRCM